VQQSSVAVKLQLQLLFGSCYEEQRDWLYLLLWGLAFLLDPYHLKLRKTKKKVNIEQWERFLCKVEKVYIFGFFVFQD